MTDLNEILEGCLGEEARLCFLNGLISEGEDTITFKDKKRTLTVTNTGELIEITFKTFLKNPLAEDIKQFKEFIENIDDDVFIEACEEFGKDSLDYLNDLISNKIRLKDREQLGHWISLFKTCVRNIASSKIQSYLCRHGIPNNLYLGEVNSYGWLLGVKDINKLD